MAKRWILDIPIPFLVSFFIFLFTHFAFIYPVFASLDQMKAGLM